MGLVGGQPLTLIPKSYEGEAMGRKLVLAFFEQIDNGLVRRVHRGDLVLKQVLPADS